MSICNESTLPRLYVSEIHKFFLNKKTTVLKLIFKLVNWP